MLQCANKKLIKTLLNHNIACLELKYGIVTYFGPSDPALDKQLESISTSLGIPLISTAPRTLAQTPGGSHHSHFGFSAENLVQKQELTLALFPSQEHLIRMVKDLAKKLEWKDVAVIHDPVNGKSPSDKIINNQKSHRLISIFIRNHRPVSTGRVPANPRPHICSPSDHRLESHAGPTPTEGCKEHCY